MANENRLFQSAFQISPVALAITIASTGRYVDVNESWLKLFEFNREEVIGRTSKDLKMFLKNYAERETAVSLIIKQGSVRNQEINANTKTGKLLRVLYSAEIVPVDNEKYILSSIIDITERKKAVEALRVSEEHYRGLFSNIDDGFELFDVVYDNAGSVCDLRYLEVNTAYEKQSGVSAAKVLGKTVKESFPNIEQLWIETFGKVAQTGEPTSFEDYNQSTHRYYHAYAFRFAENQVGVLFKDITEQRKAEQALKESEQLYRTLFENTEDGFQLFKPLYDEANNPRDLLILEVNKAYERQTGLKESDVVGKTVKAVIPNIEPYWISTYGNVAKTGKAVHIENYSRSTNRWYDVYAFLYAEGQVGALFRDITERKKAEEALRQSEERFFKAFNSNPSAMTIAHLPDGLWVDVNESFLRLTEYTKEEVIGHTSTELNLFVGAPAERAQIINLMSKQGKVDNIEISARTKTGKPLSLLLSAVKVVLNGQEYAITTQIDLTDRKKAEEALSYNERLLSIFFDSPGVMRGIVEVIDDKDIRHLKDNVVTASYLGLTSKDLENRLSSELGEPADRINVWLEHYRESRKTGKPVTWEYADTQGSKITWLSPTVAYIGKGSEGNPYFTYVVLDITERKLIEETLKESEKKYHELYESFDEAFIAINWEFNVIHWNKAAERITTVPAKEALGKKVYEVLPEMMSVDVTPYFEALKKKKPARFMMNFVSRETKRPSVFEISTYPSVLGIIIIVEDKTEEEEIKRLSVIGTTAGMVGHDIRNPLQAIMSDIYLLKDELNITPECKNKEIAESIDTIEKNVVYINKIVQDLQDFSRSISAEYEEVNLTDVFTNMFKVISVPDTIILKIDIKDDEQFRTDPLLLQRALSNLVTNAIQAMPKGGNLEIGGQPKDDQIVITVKDTGHGIPDEIKSKLFTPMMTTKAKGQGFGLAVSKRLIEAMRGTITFESEKGKGTTFIINLPLAPSKLSQNR